MTCCLVGDSHCQNVSTKLMVSIICSLGGQILEGNLHVPEDKSIQAGGRLY